LTPAKAHMDDLSPGDTVEVIDGDYAGRVGKVENVQPGREEDLITVTIDGWGFTFTSTELRKLP
jgi:transcription antitermination factor NusG